MAVIRDMMPAFQLFQPTTTDEALGLLDEYQEQAWVLAGGLDSFDWLKDRVKRPAAVVDLGGVEELSAIRSATGGELAIGAMAKLREVIRHPDVSSRYALLAEAAELVASPQIRNQGTLGGNLVQDTRCWYYRDGWNCYRAGGNICYADTPTAMNREHCILGRAAAWRSTRRTPPRRWWRSTRRWTSAAAPARGPCRPSSSSSARTWTSCA